MLVARRDGKAGLTVKQREVLNLLLDRKPDEHLNEIALKANISLRTVYRYLDDKNFSREYKKIIDAELSGARHKMADALIKGGLKPGVGQPAMQKLFWQLTGDFKDSLEISGPDGGPVEIQASTIPVEQLSFHVKRLILFELQGGQISKQAVSVLMGEIDAAEANGGNGNGQMKVIETSPVYRAEEIEDE